MAQHVNIDSFEQKAVQKIAQGIRNQRDFSGSLKYEEITDKDFKETEVDRVFVKHCNVPASIVAGGRATIEVHTKPRAGWGQEATNIYLVA